MSKEKIESLIRDRAEAVVKKDVEKALSFFAEDATLVTPEGTFKGKEEIKRYYAWVFQSEPELTATDTGIGIMVQGNKAVHEHIYESTTEGMKWQTPGTCVYEFSDEKIQHLRVLYDRLSIAKQVARGWLAKRVVNSIVKRAEKGLH